MDGVVGLGACQAKDMVPNAIGALVGVGLAMLATEVARARSAGGAGR